MFNFGSKEILIIAIIILFLFGSKKLTEWAKGIGEAGKELKKAKREFSNAWEETDKDIKKTFDMNEEIKEDKEDKEKKKINIDKEEKVKKDIEENEDI